MPSSAAPVTPIDGVDAGGRAASIAAMTFDARLAAKSASRDAARPGGRPSPVVVVIMGVAGSGKTTIGTLLAQDLGWSFRDADEFHPAGNIAKMAAGVPLTDADRSPWLAAIATHIAGCLARGESAVVTCSALKARYRDTLTVDRAQVRFVHLTGSFDLISERLRQRQGHFMKPEMLRSQFDALEEPEGVLQLDVAQSPDELVAAIRRALEL